MKDPIKMIQTCQETGEPIFVLRAKDKCSIAAIGSYNMACTLLNVDTEQLQETQSMFREFLKWQDNNADKVKIPD